MAFGYRYWLVFAPKYASSTFLLFAHNPAGSTSLRDYSGGRERKLVPPSVEELFAAAEHRFEHKSHLTTHVSYWQSEIAELNGRYLGAEVLAPLVAGGDDCRNETFERWLARWHDVAVYPGTTVPDVTSRIDALLALWDRPIPGPWKRDDDQQVLGPRNRRGDATLPRNGEHQIETQILDQADAQVVCCGERLVDGLNALPLSRDGTGGRKGNVEADLLLLTSSGDGYTAVLAEVKHTDGSAWSAAVQNILQLRLFTLSESARTVLQRRNSRLSLPDHVPVRGLIVAPAAFYAAPGKKTAAVEAATRLLVRFRATGVTIDLATWDPTRRVIAPLPVGSPLEQSPTFAPHVSQEARARARSALGAAFVASGGVCLETGHLGYAASVRANALDVSDPAWDHIVQDFMAGAGGELEAKGGSPPKLSAIHSSAMLAVNAFGRWRLGASSLSIPGLLEGGASLSFERQCRSGLRGIPPTLDVVVDNGAHVLAIESKLLEPLSLRAPAFAASYAAVFAALGTSPWRERHQRICDGLESYKRLDVAQLLKHFLGLRATFHGRSVTLLYLFWEPANAASIPEYDVHAQEVARFAEGLEDETVRFCSMTYPQLWQAWGNVEEPGLLEHVRHLRGRYAVAI